MVRCWAMEGWRKIRRLKERARAEAVQSGPLGRGETKGMEYEKLGHAAADGWGGGGGLVLEKAKLGDQL